MKVFAIEYHKEDEVKFKVSKFTLIKAANEKEVKRIFEKGEKFKNCRIHHIYLRII